VTAPELIPEDEAARRLLISPRTLRDLRAKGKIRYVRPSPRVVGYRPEDLTEYLENQARQEEPPCPSISPAKAVGGSTTSNGKASGIMDRLAARPGGMPKGLKLISGGKSR
jgi:hypothetical protein